MKDGESYLCVERNVSLTLFKSNRMAGAKTMETSARSKSFWSFDMEILKCADCLGQKEVPCPICSKSSKVAAYKYRGTMECSRCQGRGLLAHRDGSDSK